MKATIITLAALASTAFAGTLSIANSDFTYVQNDDSNYSCYKYDLATALSCSENWSITVTFTGSSTGFNQWGTAVLATGDVAATASFTNGFQLYAGTSANGSGEHLITKINTGSESGSSLPSAATYTLTAAYTVEDGASTGTLVLSVLDSSGTTTELGRSSTISSSASISSLSTNAIGVEGWTLGTVTVTADSIASVPEPATATLSLLALAGLAARRRRK